MCKIVSFAMAVLLSILEVSVGQETNATVAETTNVTTQATTDAATEVATDSVTDAATDAVTEVATDSVTDAATDAATEAAFVPAMSEGVNASVEGSECWLRMLNVTTECANVTGASQDDVDMAMRMEIPSSEAGKCLTKCLLKSRGIMSEEGAFAPNATAEFLTQAHKNESLRAEFLRLAYFCYDKLKLEPMSKLDTCDFAYDIAACTEEFHKTLFMKSPEKSPPVFAITTP